MTEINTFSAAVDDVLARGQRPSRKLDVIGYIRQSLRECQVLSTFDRDMIEDQIIATANPHIFTVPDRFRILRTMRYNIATSNQTHTYPKERLPGKVQAGEDTYYYRAADYFTMKGVAVGTLIDIAYYEYLLKIPYYDVADRPASFSLEDNAWSYLPAYDVSDETRLNARIKVTNWLLTAWYDLIVEGGLAKLLKTVGDPRSPSSFGLYKQLQQDLKKGEPFSSLNQ